ncbi:50S ribosomal protein L24e [Candidatus Woesearchaeota archaeon]|nr:50S ribosomal protein L24e [Candidatus Woesearchaeota archaeon]
MVNCSFCGEVIPQGRGKIYVKTDGRIFNFCSAKCEKNLLKLKRKPANIRWTKAFANEKAKNK